MPTVDARRALTSLATTSQRWLSGRGPRIVASALLATSAILYGLATMSQSTQEQTAGDVAWLSLERIRLDALDSALQLSSDLETATSTSTALEAYEARLATIETAMNKLGSRNPQLGPAINSLAGVMRAIPRGSQQWPQSLLELDASRLVADLSLIGASSPLGGELAVVRSVINERSQLYFVGQLAREQLTADPSGAPSETASTGQPAESSTELGQFAATSLTSDPDEPWRFGRALLSERQPELVRKDVAALTTSADAQVAQAAGTWALVQAGATQGIGTTKPQLAGLLATVRRLDTGLSRIATEAYRAQAAELRAVQTRSEQTESWVFAVSVGLAIISGAFMFGRMRTTRINGDELRIAASTDRLTGLGNRAHLEVAMVELTERSPEVVLLHIDLDHFKPVNDTYGHAVGDRVLQLTAERLGAVADEHEGITARLGGDEFVMVLPSLPQANIDTVTRTLLDGLQGFKIGELDLTVGASIGVARGTGEVGDLLINADLALYQAKRTGRGQASTFRAEAAAFVSFVRDALIDGRVQVVYQPQIALRSGRCVGAEVLARLTDKTGTLIPAQDWLGIAEWLGVTSELFEHVVSAVSTQLKTMPPLRCQLWFNVAPNDLIRPGGADWLLDQLQRLGLPMRQLGIELTETEAITEPSRLALVIGQLRETGLGIALDDFGARNTPIGHLVDLPVTRVKLDQSLISGISEDMPPSSWVVRAMAELAGRLKIEVIAEGVTSGAQVGLLTRLGVPAAQGYLLGLPGPIERLPEAVDIPSLLQTSLSGIERTMSVGPLVHLSSESASAAHERRASHPPSGYPR